MPNPAAGASRGRPSERVVCHRARRCQLDSERSRCGPVEVVAREVVHAVGPEASALLGEPVESRLVLVRGDRQQGLDVAAFVPSGTVSAGRSDQPSSDRVAVAAIRDGHHRHVAAAQRPPGVSPCS